MTYAISEPFDDAYGRWNQFAPWDATEAFNSVAGFLTTQTHVDLRSFRNVFDLFPAPQNPDLDSPTQTALEGETQTALETNQGINLANEFWASSFSLNPNLESNPGFEVDLTGWAAFETIETITRDTTEHHSGVGSLKCVTPGTVTQEGFWTPTASAPVVSPLTPYQFSVWLKGSGIVQLNANERNGAGANVTATVSSPITLTSTWTQYALNFTTSATTAKVNLIVYTQDPGTPQAVTFYGDDVALRSTEIGIGAITVGKIAARGGWAGLQATTDGAPLNILLTSSMTQGIDLSTMTNLSMIFPDYNAFDTATSKVQMTSDPAGAFGTGHDSATVLFSSNLSVQPHMLLALSGFANAGFSLASVTGIKITLVKAVAPAANQTVTLMAIRGLVNAWTESFIDFDTRIGAICVPVTLTGAPYGGSVGHHFQFVRGNGGHEDPIPADTAINIFFSPGGGTSPNDATGANFNKLSALLRETKDIPDGLGSHIEVALYWNDASTKFEAKRTDTTGGSPGVATDFSDFTTAIGGAFDATKQYLFNVEIRGTQIDARVFEATLSGDVGNLVWQLTTTLTDTNYTYRNGRVGFIADLLTRDAFVSAITVAPTGFAELITQTYTSRTPIDGAQLATVASSDINLWNSYTGADLLIDQTKTLSGTGSYRSAKSLTTNTFIMDDWTQSYLDLAIWVPATVTLANQPQIFLNTVSGQDRLAVPKLQPAQWNLLHFDLGIFRNLITGTGYSLSVQAAASPDRPLGFFWVDNTVIGRRRVAWYMRAAANGPYRPFKDLVNKSTGAVHLNPGERGTLVQLKAVALTEDAWVSSFKLFPRYAQLGNSVTDQAYDTA